MSARKCTEQVELNERALDEGGLLASLPAWSNYRTDLRITVRIDAEGRRRYDLREWFLDDDGAWRAGRRGMNNLAGSDLRGLLALLADALPLVPTRRTVRHRKRVA